MVSIQPSCLNACITWDSWQEAEGISALILHDAASHVATDGHLTVNSYDGKNGRHHKEHYLFDICKWNWKAADIWTHNYKYKPFEDMTTREHGDINNLDEVMDFAAQSWVTWLCCWRCRCNGNWSHQRPQNDLRGRIHWQKVVELIKKHTCK